MNAMIYRRIRDLREDKDLTQAQISKLLLCSQRVYSNYERGDVNIPTDILIKLADLHGVSVDYLLGRTDTPPNSPAKRYEAIPLKNNLKKLRKDRGLTQVAVQLQTGIEQALLSKFETGERIPSTQTLVLLADFYGVSIDYILCRTDKPEINR